LDRSFETQLSLAPPVLDCVNSHHRDLRGDGRLFCDRLCRGGQKVGRAVNFRADPGMVGDPRSFLDVYDLSCAANFLLPPLSDNRCRVCGQRYRCSSLARKVPQEPAWVIMPRGNSDDAIRRLVYEPLKHNKCGRQRSRSFPNRTRELILNVELRQDIVRNLFAASRDSFATTSRSRSRLDCSFTLV
jgi:hypothetical protein